MSSKLKGMLYGFITADALGVPFEFKPRGSFEMTEMTGYGTYNLPPGTWSDDSSLLLCTVEQLYKDESLEDLMQKFSDYAFEDYMTPHNNTFDIGITTMQACERFKYQNKKAVECGMTSENSNGNGSLMRIAPLVPITKEMDLEDKLKIIKDYSSLTHGHNQSVIGCLIYILMLEKLYDGIEKSDLMEAVEKDLQSLDVDYSVYDRIFHHIEHLNVDDIRSSGYVVHSLEAAVYCFMNYDTFDEGVYAAINLGEDTDTIGAITGGLYGMHLGMTDEIEQYKARLENLELVEEHIDQYLAKYN